MKTNTFAVSNKETYTGTRLFRILPYKVGTRVKATAYGGDNWVVGRGVIIQDFEDGRARVAFFAISGGTIGRMANTYTPLFCTYDNIKLCEENCETCQYKFACYTS